MSKIVEYFENLDKKNFLMLIFSLFLLTFIALYYIYDYFSQKEFMLLQQKRELLKNINRVSNLDKALLEARAENKKLKTELMELESDLKYLLSEIESSNVLVIKNKKFLNILHSYIDAGSDVGASFIISQNKTLDKYKIDIKGSVKDIRFFDFMFFIKTIETPHAIITIDNFDAVKNKDFINYNMSVIIWSFK